MPENVPQPEPSQERPAVPTAAVVLAAGKSTRMRSRIPKPLHPLCGRPLTRHVIDACRRAGVDRVIVVVGHQADAVREGLGTDVEYAVQEQQRGSGDAARAAEALLAGFEGDVLVVAGDVPLLRAETLAGLIDHHRVTGASATLLTAVLEDASGYGRIVRNPDGTVSRIVEHKDASDDELEIREWNPSIYCFDAGSLFPALSEVRDDNAQGELYLTDVVGIMSARGLRVEAMLTHEPTEVIGVNNRIELAEAAAIMRQRILTDLMVAGVTVLDPASTYVDAGVCVGRDTVLAPSTFLQGCTVVGEGCDVGPFSCIADSRIGDHTRVVASHIADSEVGSGVHVGPFANIRNGTRVGDAARVGDFVELKNSALGDRASAGHLTYIGDADVGEGANIGAGTITCNYDGYTKHRTIIGRRAFVGSHATLIAPVTIGDNAVVAAGSPVDEDVPADALAIARSRPTIKPGWARRWREKHGG